MYAVTGGDGAGVRRGVAPQCSCAFAAAHAAGGRATSRGKSRAPRCTAKSMARRVTPWDRRPGGRGGCRRGTRARRARGTCGIRACRAPAGCSPAQPGRGAPASGSMFGHVAGARGVSRLRRCPKVRAPASRAVNGSPRFHVPRSVAISEVWRYSSVKTERARHPG